MMYYIIITIMLYNTGSARLRRSRQTLGHGIQKQVAYYTILI